VALAATCWLVGCAIEPQTIHLGEDECSYCRMRISDPQFAAQLLTSRGRAYKFDAIECLAAFDVEATVAAEAVHSRWVLDFREPGRWLRAEQAHYLQSEQLRSPMALNFSAYPNAGAAAEGSEEHGGELLRWEELRARVREAWQISAPAAHP
jgi:copper chaperone NosL